MKKICLLNGSLKGERAASLAFLKQLSSRMDAADFRIDQITVQSGLSGGSSIEALATVADADAIVMAFPLFSYSLPGGFTRFLEDFERHNSRVKVYAIINCGFPEPRIMEEAIRVVKNFCARLGLNYRFSIAIGSGPVTVMTMKVPFLNPRLKKALAVMAKDAGGDETVLQEDVFITPIIPRGILIKIKEHYEKKSPSLYAPAARRAGTVSPRTIGRRESAAG